MHSPWHLPILGGAGTAIVAAIGSDLLFEIACCGSRAMKVRRGDVFIADLSPVVGSEQGGVRPVVVMQNNVGNAHSPTVIVAAITSQMQKAKLPTHVVLCAAALGLGQDSIVLLEQLRTVDKSRLRDRIAHLRSKDLTRIEEALKISLGLG